MNTILLQEKDFVSEDEVLLKDRRCLHARDILKSQKGDSVRVGILGGKLGTGTVLESSQEALRMKVICRDDPLPKHDITLVLALPRPPVLRRLFSAVTALGIKEMAVIQSARVEKSYWNSPVLNEGNVREALMLGLEQARDTILPEISFEKRFKPFVEDRLPAMIKGKRCLVARAQGADPCPGNVTDPVVLAVGPEGGFVDFEVQKFCGLGFQPVHLGQRILRVETAVQALIGRVMRVQ